MASSGRAQTMDTVIDKAIDVLSGASQILSNVTCAPPGMGTVIECLKTILQTIRDARKNRKDAQGLCDKISELSTEINRMAQVIQKGLEKFKTDPTASVQFEQSIRISDERVNTLHNTLNDIANQVSRILKRSRFSLWLHSKEDAETLTDLEKRVADAVSMFQLQVISTIEGRVNEIAMSMEKMQTSMEGMQTSVEGMHASMGQTQKDEERARCLQQIPRVDNAQYGAGMNAPKSRFEKGTRENVMKLLKGWAQWASKSAPSQPSCLLIGEAGIGKSTIMVEFCEYLKKSDHGLGASWLFNKDTLELSTSEVLFSSIASQLAASQPQLRNLVADAAGEYLKGGSAQHIKDQFDHLLRGPLNALNALPTPHPPIFIVIDALDECTVNGDIHIPIILDLLLSYATQNVTPLRIVLASRPTPHYIHDCFSKENIKSHLYTLSLGDFSDSARQDIEKLVRAKLMHVHPGSDQWSRLVNDLVYKARGYFLYARTALDFVLEEKDSPEMLQERIDALCNASETLSPIDQLYRTVLDTACRTAHQKMRKRIPLLLGYMVAMKDNDPDCWAMMSPRILEELTKMSEAEISIPTKASVPILNRLRSIVFFEYNDPNSPFHFVHTSFREFLVDRDRCGRDEYHIDLALAQRRLVKACSDTWNAFRRQHWQDDTGIKLVLRLATEDLPRMDGLKHVVYANNHLDRIGYRSSRTITDVHNRPPEDGHSVTSSNDVPSEEDIFLVCSVTNLEECCRRIYWMTDEVWMDNCQYSHCCQTQLSGKGSQTRPLRRHWETTEVEYQKILGAYSGFSMMARHDLNQRGQLEGPDDVVPVTLKLGVVVICAIMDMQTIAAVITSGKASISMQHLGDDKIEELAERFRSHEWPPHSTPQLFPEPVLDSLRTLEIVPTSKSSNGGAAVCSDPSTPDAALAKNTGSVMPHTENSTLESVPVFALMHRLWSSQPDFIESYMRNKQLVMSTWLEIHHLIHRAIERSSVKLTIQHGVYPDSKVCKDLRRQLAEGETWLTAAQLSTLDGIQTT